MSKGGKGAGKTPQATTKEEPLPPYVQKPLDDLWKTLTDKKKDYHSWMYTHLKDGDMYTKYKDSKTDLGGTLASCIQSGMIFYPTSDKNLALSLAQMTSHDVTNRSVLCQ